jgi:hypothetical protein
MLKETAPLALRVIAAEEHLALAERHVKRQWRIIKNQKRHGRVSARSHEVMILLLEALTNHQDYLEIMRQRRCSRMESGKRR